MNKSVVITGVSSGIGEALTRAFLSRGYRVFGSVRKEKDALQAKQDFGDKFEAIMMDVTSTESVQKAAEEVQRKLNGENLGGLINNAGIALGGPLLYQPMDEFKQHFEVNVFGLVEVCKAFAPLLGARENAPKPPGKIVNIGSVSGKIAMPFVSAYASSKHAVEAITRSLRRELLLFGIDVILIGPGTVKTAIWGKATEVSQYEGTPYGQILTRTMGFFKKRADEGLSPDYIALKTVDAFENPKSKTRYALVNNKFKNWTLLRMLPERVFDRKLGKATQLLKD